MALIFENFQRIMGYDTERFENSEQIDKDLICSICTDVLQDPVYFRQCEHSFCRQCITRSLKIRKECPLDRNSCKLRDLKPIVRFMKKSLNQLRFVLYLWSRTLQAFQTSLYKWRLLCNLFIWTYRRSRKKMYLQKVRNMWCNAYNWGLLDGTLWASPKRTSSKESRMC